MLRFEEVFYVSQQCPVCRKGHIAFCRCADNCRIALMCIECESLWEHPEDITAVHAKFPPHAADTGSMAHWATQMEIELRGWLEFIAGELLAMGTTDL